MKSVFRKRLYTLISAVTAAVFLAGALPEPLAANAAAEASGIFLNTTKVSMATLETVQLEAEVTPSYARDKSVVWKSSNPSVASVSADGLVTANAYGTCIITATNASGQTARCRIQTRFYDVNNSASSFFAPVYWAADLKITANPVSFGISDPVTRGQFVTFLWRLSGKPAAKAGKKVFTDVTSSMSVYKAVMWGVGEGIIAGYSDGTFRPQEQVTRQQVAVMLWRYAGKPAPVTTVNPFPDVKKSSSAYKAILWGAENGIIKGSKGKFNPSSNCTRGQTVSFLYRYNKIRQLIPDAPITVKDFSGDAQLYAGERLSISVEAEGSGLTYQWQYRKAGQTAWTNVGKATAAAYRRTATASMDRWSYRCVIRDSAGHTKTTEDIRVLLRPQEEQTAISVQPANASGRLNGTAYASITVTPADKEHLFEIRYRFTESEERVIAEGTTGAGTVRIPIPVNSDTLEREMRIIVRDRSTGEELAVSDPFTVTTTTDVKRVTYDANGGTFPDGRTAATYYVPSGSSPEGAETPEPPQGMFFDCWCFDAEGNNETGGSFIPRSDVTLYARYAVIPSQIVFEEQPSDMADSGGIIGFHARVSYDGNTWNYTLQRQNGGSWENTDVQSGRKGVFFTIQLDENFTDSTYRIVASTGNVGPDGQIPDGAVISDEFTVTLLKPDPVITTQPVSVHAPIGSTGEVAVSVSPDDYEYYFEWRCTRREEAGDLSVYTVIRGQWARGGDSMTFPVGLDTVRYHYWIAVKNDPEEDAIIHSDPFVIEPSEPYAVVTLDANGGAFPDGSLTVNTFSTRDRILWDSDAPLPPEEGWTFLGWFTDGDCGNEYDYYFREGSFTLYAGWEEPLPPPVFTEQPQSVLEPGGTTVHITASISAARSYYFDWQRAPKDGSGDWETIDRIWSDSTAGLELVVGTDTDSYQYRVVIRETSEGEPVLVSGTFFVESYNPGDAAILTPPSDRFVRENSDVSFTVSAENAASYRWQMNTGSGWTDIADGGKFSGSGTETLTVSGTGTEDTGTLFRCVAVSAAGGTAESEAAALIVAGEDETVVR